MRLILKEKLTVVGDGYESIFNRAYYSSKPNLYGRYWINLVGDAPILCLTLLSYCFD